MDNKFGGGIITLKSSSLTELFFFLKQIKKQSVNNYLLLNVNNEFYSAVILQIEIIKSANK
ncbi:hypothetical protein SAMN04488131_10373 [Flavobacterium xueshanense]|uniref:Uncharacterized protein n=1 Tax=Flavobacterium xueshanense TaxID=935223 RepID=A0A1I2CHP8_9FLAO|nr:hypothetical protein SAMN04488131_10373 [Flavobacterium xueshanense]